MKVFFGCTSQQIDLYYPVYKQIRDYLLEKKHVITFDWLDDAFKDKKAKHTRRDINNIFSHVIKGIEDADAVIIEATVANFSVAHQLFYAITRKKPVLVLWQKSDNEPYLNSYLDVFKSSRTLIEKYSSSDFEAIIDKFLIRFEKKSFGGRYNIVLDKESRYLLDLESQKSGLSRSAIIRQALKRMK